MIGKEYTLEEISYSRKEDRRIMESVLSFWFADPKTLNFVSPDCKYPFDFMSWIKLYNKDNNSKTATIVLKHNDWIIGHVSIEIEKKISKVFHLFLEQEHRKKGLSIRILEEIEKYGKESGTKFVQASIQKKDTIFLELLIKSGYKNQSMTNSKSTTMIKSLW